jgi:hypothetical protein
MNQQRYLHYGNDDNVCKSDESGKMKDSPDKGRRIDDDRSIRAGGEISRMPRNSSSKIDDQQNASSIREKSRSIRLDKMSRYPPSLNKINKNLP